MHTQIVHVRQCHSVVHEVDNIAAVGSSNLNAVKYTVLQPRQPSARSDLFFMRLNGCRGILFHGAPGTGKTLVARALAGACSHSQGGSAVTLFARKGADCLGKFAGEAERTLRLLFDEVCPCKLISISQHFLCGRHVC